MRTIREAFAALACLSLSVAGFCGEVRGAVILDSSLTVSEAYTDNLFFSQTGQETDLATTIAPFLSIGYTSKNIVFSLGYEGSAQFYSQNPEASGYFQTLSADIDIPILNRQSRRLEVHVIEEVNFSPELIGFSFGKGDGDEEESLQEANPRAVDAGQGVQIDRTDTFQNQAGISLDYDWTEQFNTTTAYTNIITRFSDKAFEDRNAHQGIIDGRYRYPLSPRTSLIGSYDLALTKGKEADRLIHSLHFGMNHRINRLISADGSAGVSFINGESAQHVLSAGLARRFKSGLLSVRYSNSIRAGLGILRSVFRKETASLNANGALGDRIASYFQVGYSKTESLSLNEVDAVISTGRAGVSVQFLAWLNGRLEYSFLKQKSRGELGAEGGIKRNILTLSITAIVPSRRIIK